MADLGDILRVTPSLVLDVGVTIQNVYHLLVSEPTGVDDEDVLDDMGEYLEGIYDGMVSRIPNNVTFSEYKVDNLTADVTIGISGFPTLTTGTDAGEYIAPGVAGLLLGRTSNPGHAGRKFFGPFTEGNMSDGLWSSALLSVLAAAGLDTYDGFTSAGGNDYQPIVLDRTTGNPRNVREIIASSNPAYQRRRRRGAGI
jgi:hypothetical protein